VAKKGLILSILGIMLGICTGFTILIFQNYLVSELTDLLQKEVKQSSGCDFHYDSLSVSLLTLSAEGENAQILCDGKSFLRFKNLYASFSIAQIREKIILINHLVLSGGSSTGIGPDSPTFKFIDSLTSSPPPEKDKPGRWKAHLVSLNIKSSDFTEPAGKQLIIGRNFQLAVKRNPIEGFDLFPKVEKITSGDNERIPLGRLDGELHINDDKIIIKKAVLESGNSRLEISAESDKQNNRRLNGKYQYSFLASDQKLPVSGAITSNGEISGVLSRPQADGKITLGGTDGMVLNILPGQPLKLDSLNADFHLNYDPSKPLIDISNLKAEGQNLSISQDKSFTINKEDLLGSLSLNFRNLNRDGIKINNLQIAQNLGGTLSDPKFDLKIDANDLAYNDSPLPKFQLEGGLSGFTSRDKLKGDFTAKFTLPVKDESTEILGTVKIDNSKMLLELADLKKNVSANLAMFFDSKQKSNLNVKVVNLAESPISYIDRCLNFSAELGYDFDFIAPAAGTGALKIDKFIVGCEPYIMRSANSISLPIEKGVLNFQGVNLQGEGSSLQVSGSASANNLDITGNGSIQLKSFLNLFPKIDDLKGSMLASVKVGGTPQSPLLSGNIAITDGQLDIESSDISAQKINGKLNLVENYLNIEKLSGELNGGQVSLQGSLHPFAIEKSELTLKFNNIYTSPLEGLNMELSGEIAVENLNGGAPILRGEVEIDRGEFQRSIELTNVIKSIPAYLLGRRKSENPDQKLPDVELDLKIVSARNLFILTNLLNAELQADLDIKGNLNQPVTSGKVEVLNGWLGFKDRIFEINSGKLIFLPGQREPFLELIGEAFVNSKSGLNIQVILEATGNVSAPRIVLSSDRGLNEQELLALITSGSGFSTQTRVNSLERNFDFNEERPNLRNLLTSPKSFVEFLTSLDSLSIEPTYNYLTGSVDPSIIARKQILDRMYLEGKSFVGSAENLARAQLVYNLTPAVNVSGLLESVSSRKGTAVEFNSTYTILSSQSRNLGITISGNDELSELSILHAIRVNENSRVPCTKADQIKQSIKEFYAKNGFFDAEVNIESKCDLQILSSLTVNINEGKISTIKDLIFHGDSISHVVNEKEIKNSVINKPATETVIKNLEAGVIEKLRNEGYIASRAEFSYTGAANSSEITAEVNIFLGKPVTFTFEGNKLFSARDFLETINLFNRKLPLGSNTINLLVEAIEKKYRDAGYLYATISYQKIDTDPERINYLVRIQEESPVEVKAVVFEGNDRLSKDDLRRLVLKKDRTAFTSLFQPKIVQAEVIEDNIKLLKEIYTEEGFYNSSISYNLDPAESDMQMIIRYTINEGILQKADWLEISGLPPDVKYEKLQETSYSIESANQVINNLTQDLENRGYFESSFTTRFDDNTNKLYVDFNPGIPTRVSEIEIEGNKKIKNETILKEILLKPGDAWDINQIQESRKKLFRLGLFNKVEITAKNSTPSTGSDILVVKVSERPLRSLEVGAGANSELGTHIFSQATDRSLFKDGKALSLITDLYYDPRESGISQGVAGLIYTHPNFYASDYTLTEDLRYQKLETSAQEFDLERTSLGSYLYRTYNESLTLSAGHTISDENLTNVSPEAAIGEFDTGNVRLSFLSGFVTYDKRDVPLNATSGYALNFDYKLSTKAIGSEADFFSLGTKAAYLKPLDSLNERLSLAAATHLAGAWTFSGTDEVPITQRFYTGGRNTIRGFRENSLGPRGEDGSIIGGDALFANNFELRYLAADRTSVHTFFDAGTVFLQDRSMSVADIRESIGVGMRYLSPIGPIGFDIGHPLDERSGEPSVRFHFNIGSNF
jgi:outer membrane protein insertion porin family